MGFLDVEVERARNRVVAVGDGVKGRCHAVDERALDLLHVLVEEAEAEDAERIRVGLQLLHDQVVVLAGLDECAVFTDRMADRLVAIAIRRLQGSDPGRRLASALHGQLDECITRTRSRRRTEHLDLGGRQFGVHIGPGLVGILDEFALSTTGHFLGQCEEDIFARQFHRLGADGIGEDDTVVTDLNFDDLGDAIGGAGPDFGRLDGARRVRDVGIVHTNAVAEQLQAAARTGRLDLRRLELAAPAESLRNDGREWIDCRRADDIHVITTGLGEGAVGQNQSQDHQDGQGCNLAMYGHFGISGMGNNQA